VSDRREKKGCTGEKGVRGKMAFPGKRKPTRFSTTKGRITGGQGKHMKEEEKKTGPKRPLKNKNSLRTKKGGAFKGLVGDIKQRGE